MFVPYFLSLFFSIYWTSIPLVNPVPHYTFPSAVVCAAIPVNINNPTDRSPIDGEKEREKIRNKHLGKYINREYENKTKIGTKVAAC